ncbi:hypothetical protein J7I94_13755 [Streptomyces sp. ISL-12]|uniref:hypothetical protein n=1 Tax=Streptomyces sp. ISL-12 TaxID=2819177 RepID=UPI001BE94330|nr:hypothetical protein [Streptomyces sp. ISL-12]MBT2411620.1 hypothetical protein [Streptomyces sp. ISL-12]
MSGGGRWRTSVRPSTSPSSRTRSPGLAFTYEELAARDKANLDITWLRDPSLDDADSLPAPEVLAADAGPCRRKP